MQGLLANFGRPELYKQNEIRIYIWKLIRDCDDLYRKCLYSLLKTVLHHPEETIEDLSHYFNIIVENCKFAHIYTKVSWTVTTWRNYATRNGTETYTKHLISFQPARRVQYAAEVFHKICRHALSFFHC
jgi:hypothetical protein